MNDHGKMFENLLQRIEKKQRKLKIGKGLISFSSVLLASLAITLLLSHIYQNITYFSLLKITAFAAACAGFLWYLLPAVTNREKRAEVVKELNNLLPALGEDTINAYLLKPDLQKSEKETGVSKKLIEAHIDKVTRKLRSEDLSDVFPLQNLTNEWKRLGGAFLLFLITFILAPGGFSSFLFSTHFLPTSDANILELADVKISYSYPDYTGISPNTVEGSAGHVEALRGTEVTFEAVPLNQLREPKMIIENGPSVPLKRDGRKIKGEFTLLSNGSFTVESGGGLRSKIFNITAKEDRSPAVKIISPSENIIEANENDTIDFFYEAEDDFGITKIELVWDGGSGEKSKLIGKASENPTLFENRYTWDLSGVSSLDGEILRAKIKAYDNDTVSGPKAGISNTVKIKIKDRRERHAESLALAEKLMNELLEVLADDIESARLDNLNFDNLSARYPNSKNYTDSTAKRVSEEVGFQEKIAGKIENALTTLDQTLAKMEEDRYSDYTYFAGLSNMRVRIGALLEERRDLLESFTQANLSRLDGLITREINEFEDDILFLDSMLKGEKLKESILAGKSMLNEYEELSRLLEKLKQRGDDKTRAEVARKMEQLRNLMARLAQKLSEIGGEMREGFLNQDALKQTDFRGKMDQIAKLISEGKIDEASRLLSALRSDLESMVASLQSSLSSFSSASLSKELEQLGELISRLEGIEKEETSLKNRTENLKESLLDNTNSRDTSPEDFIQREREKIERLKELLGRARTKVFGDVAEDEIIKGSLLLDRLLEGTEKLRNQLEASRFNEARNSAKDVEEKAIGLRNLSSLGVGKIAKAKPELSRSAELAEEIRSDLKQIEKVSTGGGEMKSLAERQAEIEGEASKLSEDLTRGGKKGTIPPSVDDKLSEARGYMNGASGSLEGKEISKAISNQGEAIKSLQAARKEAESLLQKYRMSSRGAGMPVPFVLRREQTQQGAHGVDTRYVEIPKEEETGFGTEFKENLMKALREGSPEGYSELNKKYYDRIIK